MKTNAVTENYILEQVKELRNKFGQAGRDMADLRARTHHLTLEIEELKKWAATLPKSFDSDFSHTQKPT